MALVGIACFLQLLSPGLLLLALPIAFLLGMQLLVVKGQLMNLSLLMLSMQQACRWRFPVLFRTCLGLPYINGASALGLRCWGFDARCRLANLTV